MKTLKAKVVTVNKLSKHKEDSKYIEPCFFG
uniref:Uncharacterized protein n=1 Tax=Tetranychus urticae TaxID=32264 RepID=T1K164_TETUR